MVEAVEGTVENTEVVEAGEAGADDVIKTDDVDVVELELEVISELTLGIFGQEVPLHNWIDEKI